MTKRSTQPPISLAHKSGNPVHEIQPPPAALWEELSRRCLCPPDGPRGPWYQAREALATVIAHCVPGATAVIPAQRIRDLVERIIATWDVGDAFVWAAYLRRALVEIEAAEPADLPIEPEARFREGLRAAQGAVADWHFGRRAGGAATPAAAAGLQRTPAKAGDKSPYVPAMELANRHGFASYKDFKKFLDEYNVDSKQDERHKQRRLVHAADCLRALAERDSKAEVALEEVAAAMHEQIESRKADARRKREQK